MRKTFCLIVASIALLVSSSTALGQGYPSISAAESFAAQNNIHGLCGQSVKGICAGSSWYSIYCVNKRGYHSRDCYPVQWEEHDIFGNYWSCYNHDWVRLEPDYSLSWHVDYGPVCS